MTVGRLRGGRGGGLERERTDIEDRGKVTAGV